MERLCRITGLNSEVEAGRLDAELTSKNIAHIMVCYHDSAYDGLFQAGKGWGHVEAEAGQRDEILAVLEAIRQPSGPPADAAGASPLA
jgi:hypothetical protein